jgi:CheY-like chemotaxis protein
MEIRNAPSGPLGHGETVLIVEDNDDIRALVTTRLRRFGYTAIEATDTAHALVILRSAQQIDLLFTDVVMPGGLSGPDLAELARTLRPGLKILFTSGFPDAHGGERPLDAPLLCKPYRNQELARKLHEVLQNGETAPAGKP